MNSLDGKVALVSGAARRIGGETGQLMAKAKARLVVGDVLDARGRQTVAAIATAGAQAEYVHLDDTGKVRQTVTGTVPWGRLGVPTDIAKGIVFLASDDAGYMTGAGLVVDGGVTAT
jgi:NAD(P)-dependent dehydrogenase (short-subunit alcohol dehydrogenase family)